VKDSNLLLQLCEGSLVSAWPASNDGVTRNLQWKHEIPNQFTQPAFELVPRDRGVSVPWHDNARAHIAERGSKTSYVEIQRTNPLPLPGQLMKFGTLSDPLFTRILVCHLRASVLARKLHREALPSLLPPFAQDLAAPLVFHPRAEPMLLDSTLIAWTVRWLAHL
jgi:hypothetical protein